MMTSLDPKFSVSSPTNNLATSFVVGVIYRLPSLAWIIRIHTSNTSPWSRNMSCALLKTTTYGLTKSNISCNPCTSHLLYQSNQISQVHLVNLKTHYWCHICITEQTLGWIQMVGARFQFWGNYSYLFETYALLPLFTLLSIFPS